MKNAFVVTLLGACALVVVTEARLLWSLNSWQSNIRGGWPSFSGGRTTNGANVQSCSGLTTSNRCLKVKYPKGTTGDGGLKFNAKPFGKQIEATLTYGLRFSPSFDFVYGGKLPGLAGGTGTCSGGTYTSTCFSARLMWRKNGGGEIYPYIPRNQVSNFCSTNNVECNWDYGHSMGRNSFYFRPGRWHSISEYIKLNTPGSKNGVVKLWVDGKLVYTHRSLNFRNSGSLYIDGIKFSTFFGGSGSKWEAKKDEYAHFYQFRVDSGESPHTINFPTF